MGQVLRFPISPIDAFDDKATLVMGRAFDAACTELGDIGKLAREFVADRIISAARRGERDPTRLRDAGLQVMRPRQQ